ADRNRSHWSTSKTPSYTKSVSWQHHRISRFYSSASLSTANLSLVTKIIKICAVAHVLTFWLQKEIDNSRREK
ncbi:hypothetical protein ACQ949_23075, partial [Escherichia coli]|nr:hypothetical protein [Escherichia coli]MDA7019631.1 hypothetical protein [Escherichia coli]